MALQGTLETFYLSSLLQLLCNDKKTGVLRIKDGRAVITVTIKDGTIIHASSTMQKEQLGALLRSQGIISSDELAGFLQTARKKNQKLGKVLVDEGRLQPEELQRFIQMQVEHILYTLFLWQKGTFEYEDCTLNLENEIITELDIMEVVLEASRRVDELSVLMRHVPDATHVVHLSEHGHTCSRQKLHPDEKAVLDLIDGERTIKHIIEESGYDAFTVYKVLYSLISSGFVHSEDQAEYDIEVSMEALSSQPPSQDTDQLFRLVSASAPAPLPESEQREHAASIPKAETPARQPSGAPADLTEDTYLNDRHNKQDGLSLDLPAKKNLKKIQIGPLPKIPLSEEFAAVPEASSEKKIFGISPKHAAMSGAVFVLLLVAAASLYFMNASLDSKSKIPSPAAPKSSVSQEPEPRQDNPSPEVSVVQKPALQELPAQESITDEPPADIASYQDSNAFFFVSLPQGYTVQDTSTGTKTNVLITYAPNISVRISAGRHTDPWHAETEMYNKMALLQQPHNGFASARIDGYSLFELGGGNGYEIAASGYRGASFCKLQVYCLTGYQKTVSIEIICQNCRNPQIEELFNRIKESIINTFLLYP